jgi:hypothetical protein
MVPVKRRRVSSRFLTFAFLLGFDPPVVSVSRAGEPTRLPALLRRLAPRRPARAARRAPRRAGALRGARAPLGGRAPRRRRTAAARGARGLAGSRPPALGAGGALLRRRASTRSGRPAAACRRGRLAGCSPPALGAGRALLCGRASTRSGRPAARSSRRASAACRGRRLAGGRPPALGARGALLGRRAPRARSGAGRARAAGTRGAAARCLSLSRHSSSYSEICWTIWPVARSSPSRATSACASIPTSRPSSSTTGSRRTWC